MRRARTMTQTDLAHVVGVTQETISKAERGRLQLSRDVQARIATVLGTSVDDLFQEAEA